jgi:hypothetical protein
MTMCPSVYRAALAVSSKVFMPFLNDEIPVFFRQFLCACEFPDFQAYGFTKLDGILHVENSFTIALPNVNVDWSVIVAVKGELEAVFLED